jgi:hypothetical protein
VTTRTEFQAEYQLLLLKQYFQKAKAKAEIGAWASAGFDAFQLYEAFASAFDLDTAIGAQLDIIGKWVGIKRSQAGSALSDDDYRFLIRCKIGVNNVQAVMVSDDGRSIQDIVRFVFGNAAFVLDNQDMSLSLVLSEDTNIEHLLLVLKLGLLPKPQAVRYFPLMQYESTAYFGFVDDDDPAPEGMLGFSEQNDDPEIGGAFAELFTEY